MAFSGPESLIQGGVLRVSWLRENLDLHGYLKLHAQGRTGAFSEIISPFS